MAAVMASSSLQLQMDFLHGICHEISDELLQLLIGLAVLLECVFFQKNRKFHGSAIAK